MILGFRSDAMAALRSSYYTHCAERWDLLGVPVDAVDDRLHLVGRHPHRQQGQAQPSHRPPDAKLVALREPKLEARELDEVVWRRDGLILDRPQVELRGQVVDVRGVVVEVVHPMERSIISC